jgi:(p)ppGpp synthase/HD superfamily hydrolase
MLKKTDLLEKAILIAVKAHTGQTDKAGTAYILHCLRVMLKGKTEDEQIAGVLHDIVEDTDVTIDSLKKQGFPEKITRAVRCLTKTKGMDYDKYVAGVKKNNIASKVKLYDLEDNLDLLRLEEVKEKDLIRLNKYLKTYRELSDKVRK